MMITSPTFLIHGIARAFTILALAGCMSLCDAEEGPRLDVGVPGTTHKAGEPVRIQITFVNPGAKKLLFKGIRGGWGILDYDVELRGPDMKEVAISAYQKSIALALQKNDSVNFSKVSADLSSDEHTTRDLVLSLYFDCTAEGEYSGTISTKTVTDADGKSVKLTGAFIFKVVAP